MKTAGSHITQVSTIKEASFVFPTTSPFQCDCLFLLPMNSVWVWSGFACWTRKLHGVLQCNQAHVSGYPNNFQLWWFGCTARSSRWFLWLPCKLCLRKYIMAIFPWCLDKGFIRDLTVQTRFSWKLWILSLYLCSRGFVYMQVYTNAKNLFGMRHQFDSASRIGPKVCLSKSPW